MIIKTYQPTLLVQFGGVSKTRKQRDERLRRTYAYVAKSEDEADEVLRSRYEMAQAEGLEPPTNRLTAGCSTN
jgi:hypothetical protein